MFTWLLALLPAGGRMRSTMLAVGVTAVAVTVLIGAAAVWWADVKDEIKSGARAQCDAAIETARADQAEARETALRAALAERDWTLSVRAAALDTRERELADAEQEREKLRAELDKRAGSGDLIGLDAEWLRGRRAASGQPRPGDGRSGSGPLPAR